MRDLLLVAAVLGSHSNFAERGFRQKDIRFLFELFANWLDVRVDAAEVAIHNTQVMRFVESLLRSGYASSLDRKKFGRFSLTRLGLIELIQRVHKEAGAVSFVQFLFSYYFIFTYRNRLIDLIHKKGSGFSRSLQVELDHLLDHTHLAKDRLQNVEARVQRVRLRIQETKELIKFIQKNKAGPKSLDQIVDEASTTFPYDLNAQKPMADLLREIPADLRLFELGRGNELRIELLWENLLTDLQSERDFLRKAAAGKVSDLKVDP